MLNNQLKISNIKYRNKQRFFVAGIVIFAGIFRLIPHPANFAPITALALFSGAYLDKKYALIIPLAAMFVSDWFLGFHSDMVFVYASFLLIGFLGIRLKHHKNIKNIFLTTIFSSILFFIVTNFGVWLMTNLYPKNAPGLIEAFILAIPFFKNTLMGDLLFTASFFTVFEVFKAKILKETLVFKHVARSKS